MSDRPYSIYSTWGFHDELGDQVRLTEQLAHRALDELERWRRDYQIGFDYFHLDCFWFDPARGYEFFNPETWPHGFDPVLDRILEAGMKPGLWYSTNGVHLAPDEWRSSQTDQPRIHTLAEGDYAAALERSLFHAAEKWSVRFYKFDFAHFHLRVPGSRLTAEENYRLSVERMLGMLDRLRQLYPDIKVITHCGYAREPLSTEIGAPDRYSPDRSLLGSIDKLFSGDPRYAAVAQTSISRGLDLFQDRGVWKMAQDGVPLDRIDDHGALIAGTNTCHYRGRMGFRRTHLGQLARGGRRDMFYGDPTLLTPDDLTGLAAARTLFFDAYRRGLTTCPVGAGEPGVAPWHGFVTGEGIQGIAYLVNPSLHPVTASFRVVNLTRARLLFYEGATAPPVQTEPDYLHVTLQAEQMAVVGLGRYATAEWDTGHDPLPPLPADARRVPVEFRCSGNHWIAELHEALPPGYRLHVRAQALDTEPLSVQDAAPFRFAAQDNRTSSDRTPRAHDLLTISFEQDGQPQPWLRQVPEVPIWSGVSVVFREFDAPTPGVIRVVSSLNPARLIRVAAYAIRYEQSQADPPARRAG